MKASTTTIRVSVATHRLLSELAARTDRSISEVLEQLAERERRRQMLDQYNERMAAIMAEPTAQQDWRDELALSEATAAEVVERAAEK